MIHFIQPYFNQHEAFAFQNHEIPRNSEFYGMNNNELDDEISAHFPNGDILIEDKGEKCIRLAAEEIHARLSGIKTQIKISIPSAICGSVYRAVKDFGDVTLMDAEEDWNCIYDEESQKADIVLIASLGGKRMEIPEASIGQLIIDDAAQCFDGVCGLRDGSAFSIFSFGIGKQMAVGVGGILYSKNKIFFQSSPPSLERWQKCLILSQLSKIGEINRLRKFNGITLIDELSHLDWIRLPSTENNVFSKFVIFIDQGRKPVFEFGRTPEILRFMRHMYAMGVQVEETYIPLHVRFPSEFKDSRYKDFNVNGLWPEAITLPCRPNLTSGEMDQIIDAVKKFEPSTKRVPVELKFDTPSFDNHWVEDACACIKCNGKLTAINNNIICSSCKKIYKIANGIPIIVKHEESHLEKIKALSIEKPRWFNSDQNTYYESGPYRHHLKRRKEYVSSVIEKIIKEGRHTKYLDFGCGDGQNMKMSILESLNVYGSDYNIERLSKAKDSLGLHSKLLLCDVFSMPFIENFFDIIFMNHVLEHIEDDTGALENIHKILSPGGFLILGVPNEGSVWWQLAYKLEPEILKASDHVHFYTLGELSAKVSIVGFEIIETKYMGYGLPHWSADSVFRNIEGVDDIMEEIGQNFFQDQASSMYLILRKP